MPNRFVNIDKLLFSWIHSVVYCICSMKTLFFTECSLDFYISEVFILQANIFHLTSQ